ncbi:MAG: T9SS type A sorting domain-containing protein [Flavobacteriales bacterium]|nr:T9SS type A sorting domain-containing protein [Flavobacteriales bacterium]
MNHVVYSCLIYLLVSSVSASAQETVLSDFNVYEHRGTVYINCTVATGNTCNGIDVMRSTDSLSFIQVGHISGICGSISEPVTYNFTDENPVRNATNFYKLQMGGVGYSHVLSVEIIDTKAFGFQIRPNPANEQVTIFIDNDFEEEHKLEVYSMSGRKMVSTTSRTNEFKVNTTSFRSGIYFFQVRSAVTNGDVLTGKFLVSH